MTSSSYAYQDNMRKYGTDRLRPVTLVQRGKADIVVPYAFRKEVSYKEAVPTGGYVQQGDIAFRLPFAYVEEQPALGSLITDDRGDTYTVLTVTGFYKVAAWRCTARNLAVLTGLNKWVRFEEATYSKNENGEALPTWTTLYSNIRAKVQSESSETQVRHEATWARNVYKITIDRSLDIDAAANYRIIDREGNEFLLERYEQSDRIDVLPVITARIQNLLVATSTSSSGIE